MNPLDGVHPLLGQTNGTPSYRKYSNWTSPAIVSLSGGHAPLSLNSESADAVTLLARTNPGRPVINIFNFLYELKDLPGMLRDIGHFKLGLKAVRTPRDVANHYLSLQMGWKPLFSDLRRMLDFSASVDRKVGELNRLYSKGGLKRRLQLGSYTNVDQRNNVGIASGTGDLVLSNQTTFTTAQRWGTVRWLPTSMPRVQPGSKEFRKYARALALGDTGGPMGPLRMQTLWNAIPWTWLTDWFGNVGEFMQAYDNSVPSVASDVCIMTRTTSVHTWKRANDGLQQFYRGGDGVATFQTLRRACPSGSLQATLPFLTARQLSILGGLAIQRIR
jgi:hypothetical protein